MLKTIKKVKITFLYLPTYKLVNNKILPIKKIPVGKRKFLLDILKFSTHDDLSINGVKTAKNQIKMYTPPKINITLKNNFLFGFFIKVSSPNPAIILTQKQYKNIILVGTAVEIRG